MEQTLKPRPNTSPNASESIWIGLLNLKAAVERAKAVQAIDGHRECTNCVVTFWVMSQLFHFLGASRGCADFRDPTAVFRLKEPLNINGRIKTNVCGWHGKVRQLPPSARDQPKHQQANRKCVGYITKP